MSHTAVGPQRARVRVAVDPSRPGRAACRVCGCAEVRTDEVAGHVALLLGECVRCGHRFTHPLDRAARLAGPHALLGARHREIPDAA